MQVWILFISLLQGKLINAVKNDGRIIKGERLVLHTVFNEWECTQTITKPNTKELCLSLTHFSCKLRRATPMCNNRGIDYEWNCNFLIDPYIRRCCSNKVANDSPAPLDETVHLNRDVAGCALPLQSSYRARCTRQRRWRSAARPRFPAAPLRSHLRNWVMQPV